MVISDQPPPTTVPASRVIRGYEPQQHPAPAARAAGSGQAAAPAPGAANAASGTPSPALASPTGSSAESTSSAAPAAPSAADRQLEARRKQLEKDAERKKRDEEARVASEQASRSARACADRLTDIRTLESGMRVARVTSSGEREYISDEERNTRIEQMRREMKEQCKSGS